MTAANKMLTISRNISQKLLFYIKGEYCKSWAPYGPRIYFLMGGKCFCSEQLAAARDICLQKQAIHGQKQGLSLGLPLLTLGVCNSGAVLFPSPLHALKEETGILFNYLKERSEASTCRRTLWTVASLWAEPSPSNIEKSFWEGEFETCYLLNM